MAPFSNNSGSRAYEIQTVFSSICSIIASIFDDGIQVGMMLNQAVRLDGMYNMHIIDLYPLHRFAVIPHINNTKCLIHKFPGYSLSFNSVYLSRFVRSFVRIHKDLSTKKYVLFWVGLMPLPTRFTFKPLHILMAKPNNNDMNSAYDFHESHYIISLNLHPRPPHLLASQSRFSVVVFEWCQNM